MPILKRWKSNIISIILSVFVFIQLSCERSESYFEIVFPQDKVNKIEVMITPSNWQAMLDDMTRNYGTFGAGKGKSRVAFWDEYLPFLVWPDKDPIYVECTVKFEDKIWQHVGIRFKGSIALVLTWWWGNYKLPFKLDFDQFEDEYCATHNQRFFGFEKLSFKNHASDNSYLRYKVATDLFREEGVPAPHVSFYRVYMDIEGSLKYFGLYTSAEFPQTSLFMTHFGADGGKLYRPAYSSPDVWTGEEEISSEHFPMINNVDKPDWESIRSAVDVLNASRDNSEIWRENLEKRFDVIGFLKWLAINSVLENWDVSGNNYLYSDPSKDGRLSWIAWDVDQSLPSFDISSQVDNFFNAPLTLDLSLVDESRPLIRFILDDKVYSAYYKSFVKEFSQGNFSAELMKVRFHKEHKLIAPYVTGEEGELPDYGFTSLELFEEELNFLIQKVEKRHEDVEDFLCE